MFKIKRLVVLALSVLVLAGASGCKSRFEKIRLSNDVGKKYTEAIKLYNKKNYSKALVLFEELAQKYRASAEAEDLNFYYAYTLYKLKDYTTARYQFKQFADTYSSSKNAEECRYMAAYCFYLDSPNYSLDQESSLKAIEALQLFINLYPKSERVVLASKYISDLRDKLERKSYMNARMYLDIGDFKSAVIAFKISLREFPDTKYAEEMEFLTIKAQYLYAKNSYVVKQVDRYKESIDYYTEFVERHPTSKYLKDAHDLKKDCDNGIEATKQQIAENEALVAKYEKEKKRAEGKVDNKKEENKTTKE